MSFVPAGWFWMGNIPARVNFIVARWDIGADLGQFNFDPAELTYMDLHYFVSTIRALHSVSLGDVREAA